jgi:hypothetical protein
MVRADSNAEDIAALLRLLVPGAAGARRVMLIGAEPGVGCSAFARRLAVEAGVAFDRPAWLYDLDLVDNPQFAFARGAPALAPGPAIDADLGQPPFWRLVAADRSTLAAPGRPMLTLHRMGESQAHVSRFRSDRLAAGCRIQIHPNEAYWRAAAQAAGVVLVDAPALDRSRAGLAVASQMDQVVIVVSGRTGSPPPALALRAELEERGARIAGVVLCGATRAAQMAARWSD